MQLSSSKYLKKCLYAEPYKIGKEIDILRKGEKRRSKDYPAVIVGAECQRITKIGRSRSRYALTGSKKDELHPLLVDALGKAGSKILGKKTNLFDVITKKGKKYFFGTCAEDDASDEIIKEYEIKNNPSKFTKLNSISFTTPIRPRTIGKKNWCVVCKTIFS